MESFEDLKELLIAKKNFIFTKGKIRKQTIEITPEYIKTNTSLGKFTSKFSEIHSIEYNYYLADWYARIVNKNGNEERFKLDTWGPWWWTHSDVLIKDILNYYFAGKAFW